MNYKHALALVLQEAHLSQNDCSTTLRVIKDLLTRSCSLRCVLDTLLAKSNFAAVIRSVPRVASLHQIVGNILYGYNY